MPYLPTAQSWLENSTLLVAARPTTARITTKYSIQRTSKTPQSSSRAPPSASTAPPANPAAQHHREPPKATLILKTYDPVSGVCLKYRTDKAAEVGRLVAALGSCGRVMAALPEKRAEDGGGEEIAGSGGGGGAGLGEGVPVVMSQQPEKERGEGKGKGGAGAAGGGGGGKKRKGKR